MSEVAPPPRGVYVPVPTWFKSSPSGTTLDHNTQATHAVYLARAGICGLVLLGSTGEAVHLTSTERTDLIKNVRSALNTAGFLDYPLIAGTATQSVAETLQHLKEAKDAGAQWGLCLAPGYFAPVVAQQGLVEWFEGVAEESALPIMVYHYPGVSNNVALTPKTMERLANNPKIVGCKLSHGSIDDHTLIALSKSIDHTKFRTFTGLGQQLLPAMTVGCGGAIDGLAAAFPRTLVGLFDNRTTKIWIQEAESPLAAARDGQLAVSRAEKLVVQWGVLGIKEAVRRVLSIGVDSVSRPPLQDHGLPGGEEEWSKWSPELQEVRVIEERLSG
ncbi:dihydrodipicolinate synthase [Trichodelitschia bisporula]|uniref:Dihydrodipicolinate synthase n=1 Tax=Trichodelitschia bisporula TaxID=703511 RepID=A0A6G1I1D5_9PEZI|nr:dihydrodipicolinate synthase [Trichodelitschia bisporula]